MVCSLQRSWGDDASLPRRTRAPIGREPRTASVVRRSGRGLFPPSRIAGGEWSRHDVAAGSGPALLRRLGRVEGGDRVRRAAAAAGAGRRAPRLAAAVARPPVEPAAARTRSAHGGRGRGGRGGPGARQATGGGGGGA